MPTAEKAQTIEQAKDWYAQSKGVIFTDYRGLSVKQVQKLRSDLRAKGGELHVIKNTLFQRAIGDDAAVIPEDLQGGPTAYAFLFDNETEIAKMLFDFATSSKKLSVKGAIFAGKPMTDKQVEAFSKLPPRDVLIAQVIGAIAAPISNLVGTIEALYADPIRVIGAVADKVAEGSPAPAPKAAAVESTPAPEAAPAEDAAPAEAPVADAPAEAPAAEATPEGEAN
jgi:large subunit ribosomal protein L10